VNIARFEPWSLVDLLHRDLDRLAQQRSLPGNDGNPVADWVPAVDITEETSRITVEAA